MSFLPLEPQAGEQQRLTGAVVEFVEQFLAGVGEAPAMDLQDAAATAKRFTEAPPEHAGRLAPLLDLLAAGATKGFNTAGPGFFAYIPGGGLYTSALADLMACVMNRYVTVWDAAPAFATLEASVVRWLCDVFGYPPAARGVLTSGGSVANFSAIVTAREALLGRDLLSGVLYTSDQAHYSVVKAARLAGLPPENVRAVASTDDLRLDVAALTAAIRDDRAKGRRPFCIVANAGTTNTGAVDPLESLAALARAEGLWLHVDAAYGGGFQLTRRGQAAFAGIDRADSITMDPHKALFLPYGTGALLVRDGEHLRAAHQMGGEYLQDLRSDGEHVNFIDYSPEMTRDFRGLRLWLPLHLHGVAAFRDALDEKLDLAAHLYEQLRTVPQLEVPWCPDLSVVAFRGQGADADTWTRRLGERVNASGRVMVSSTRVSGRFFLRACVMVHRTHKDRVDELVEIVREAAAHASELTE